MTNKRGNKRPVDPAGAAAKPKPRGVPDVFERIAASQPRTRFPNFARKPVRKGRTKR